MVSYLYNAIVCGKGEDNIVSAIITDEEGIAIEEGIGLSIYCKKRDELLHHIPGYFEGEQWNFLIPADLELEGRYFYCICQQGNSLTERKEPIYFV